FVFSLRLTIALYTPSLHDALPIYGDRKLVVRSRLAVVLDRHRERVARRAVVDLARAGKRSVNAVRIDRDTGDRRALQVYVAGLVDRKSTRLNSSHQIISYAVFCFK